MASINVSSRRPPVYNHEGVRAVHNPTPLAELRRSVCASLLFEDLFYESGSTHATRVAALIPQCKPEDVAALAIECRERMHLRHMPLFLVRELARTAAANKTGSLVRQTLARVIHRPDEITEYLALYWRGRTPGVRRGAGMALSKASMRGLQDAFCTFNAYSLGKYKEEGKAITLANAWKIVRPSPRDAAQKDLWKQFLDGTLPTPDTWETELSAGKDKRETWERLLREKKLGGLALLRNLRNMSEAHVDRDLIRDAVNTHEFNRVLPFRFIAASTHAPTLVNELSDAMLRAATGLERLSGTTAILVDCSPSMHAKLSAKSDLTREDAACGLAVLCRAVCDHARVFAFSSTIAEVPAFNGLALREMIKRAVPSYGTMLGAAIDHVNILGYDRLIVVTDEESQDAVGAPLADKPGYMINVATSQHGIGFGPWTRVSGFSERVLDFVKEVEAIRP